MGRPPKAKTELAQRLVAIRGLRTRDEFANQYGISLRVYANYERGDHEPSFALLQEIVEKEGVDPTWLLTGRASAAETTQPAGKNDPKPSAPAINPDLFKQVARILERVHARAQIRLPADARAEELARAYNLLLAKAEDPADALELQSLLPWLETHLTKTLNQALNEPGSGKREA